MSKKILLLFVVILLAFGIAFGSYYYINLTLEPVSVYKAKSFIPEGTYIDKNVMSYFEIEDMVKGNMNNNYVTDLSVLMDTMTQYDIVKGEKLLLEKFGAEFTATDKALLDLGEDYVLAGVDTDLSKAVGGMITVGNYVNVGVVEEINGKLLKSVNLLQKIQIVGIKTKIGSDTDFKEETETNYSDHTPSTVVLKIFKEDGPKLALYKTAYLQLVGPDYVPYETKVQLNYFEEALLNAEEIDSEEGGE